VVAAAASRAEMIIFFKTLEK